MAIRFYVNHWDQPRFVLLPFPLPIQASDESISVLRVSSDAAPVGDNEKLDSKA